MNRHKIFIPLIVAAGLAAYHNSFSGPFIFDDKLSIAQNQHIQQLWPPWEAMKTPLHTSVSGRPVASFTFAVNYAISGFETWSYHAGNLLIHILNALLLYGIVRRTLDAREKHSTRNTQRSTTNAPTLPRSDGSTLAATITLLWTVHPLLTDSVTYIAQRTELLMALFLLLMPYCLIRAQDSEKRRAWLTAGVVSCAVGMGCKEVMVVAPLLVLIYDRIFLADSFYEIVRRRWGFYGGLAATWFVLGELLLNNPHGQSAGLGFGDVTPLDYARSQLGVLTHYLRLSFIPYPLVLDYYDWNVARSWADVWWQTAFILSLLAATGWLLWRQHPMGFLGAVFFLILAPTSSFVVLNHELAAERRMYLPLAAVVTATVLGAFILIRVFAQRWPGMRRVAAYVVVLAAVVLGIMTVNRNEVFKSEFSIWSDTIAKRPSNARAYHNLGALLSEDGKNEEAGRFYEMAMKLDTEFAAFYLEHIGAELTRQGEFEKALVFFNRALRLKPERASLHHNLGALLMQMGREAAATASYEAALRYDPEMPEAHHHLAVVFARAGKWDKALPHFQKAARLQPTAVIYLDWADAWATQGNFDEAVAAAKQAALLSVAAGNKTLSQEITARLEFYRAGQPYREKLSVPHPEP